MTAVTVPNTFQRCVDEYRAAQKIAPNAIRFTPCDSASYYEALGAVPPQAYGKHGFLMGEPYTHNARGESVWYAFFAYGNERYAAALMTERQFREGFC